MWENVKKFKEGIMKIYDYRILISRENCKCSHIITFPHDVITSFVGHVQSVRATFLGFPV